MKWKSIIKIIISAVSVGVFLLSCSIFSNTQRPLFDSDGLFKLVNSAFFVKSANGQAASELEAKIAQRNKDIAALEEEIKGFQKQISDLGSQANSLKATISSLDLTQKKLSADISLTEKKIDAKNLEIQELGGQITNKEEAIDDDHKVIASSFMLMDQYKDSDFVTMILSGKSISETISHMSDISTVQARIVSRIKDLRNVKAGLEQNQVATEHAKADLLVLSKQLRDQRQVVINTQSSKNTLLSETKQSEAQYQKILAQKRALKAAFDQEILQYEAQLKTAVTNIPHTGSGVLSYPLDQITVTQYFGDTPFSTSNPQIYNGRGHTGVDFRASIGTPIKSALSGTVVGVGNTDLVSGCYSYGKWIMVKHGNGLSTLYGHMSLQTVKTGQEVSTGQLIGYSGNTGYSTGPHLHFGVYATEGVQIKNFSASKNCKGTIIPVASFNAYLNPMSYL